jgi:hypothetical protein
MGSKGEYIMLTLTNITNSVEIYDPNAYYVIQSVIEDNIQILSYSTIEVTCFQ